MRATRAAGAGRRCFDMQTAARATGTIGAMMVSAATPAIAPQSTEALPPQVRQIGELKAGRFRSEPIYLGPNVTPKDGFSSLDDALSGAAALSVRSGGAYAITRDGDAFQASEVHQPVWRKGFFRHNAFGTDHTQMAPFQNGREPKYNFHTYNRDPYSHRGHDFQPRQGTLTLDASAGVEAIVGSDWALVGGQLRDVKPGTLPTDPTDPTDPVDPPTGGTLVADVTEAVRLAGESARIIQALPEGDTGTDATKADRIAAYKSNLAAQAELERHFSSDDANLVSTLRAADASLEDANWQLAKKPSPDGRFNGVDIPGALADTQHAIELLQDVLADQGAA